ncbi:MULTISPECIES: polysaccharide biosynthesis C-terminal domain-containing protein [unclassified Fibrobacter]|uniref:oligosaccharide flippase family protein n=1 Tax=unclassified Fibrobacter TaxID=2634177 RepID=UPI000D6C8AF3|nr:MULTISPECIES: polysaccharide biosynthesis C-terminal domain-containing protein [unclassified Fibrobacter]PWJ62278.1 O-antigen/teichoic acid export membrane protein [Fibrobacter sp. UWR4]PZW67970.1 O-antigen/teichoic acid export membrane protein [Fibrobacter sp. UWR1]
MAENGSQENVQNSTQTSVQQDQKYLVKSAFYNLAGTVLKVLAPVLMIVVARVFDKALFGVFVSTQLWVLTMSRVSVLGLDKGLHRYLPQNLVQGRPRYEGVMASAKRTVLFAAIITVVILIAAQFGLQRLSSGLSMLGTAEISLFILSLVPWSLLHIFAGASEGNRHPQYKMFINDFAVSALAPMIALVIYFAGATDKLALPIGLLIANCLGVVAYYFIIRKQFPEMPWRTKEKLPPGLLSYSLPLGFSEVVTSFLLRMDLWMVLALIGPEAAGIYAVMVTISNGLKTIRQSYNPILTPVVAGMSADRIKTDLKPVFSYCVSMVTLIQLAIGFFIVLFPEQTMMIAGKSFITKENPVAVLGILMIGNLINGMFGLAGPVINGLGKSKFMLLMNAVSLVFAIGMNNLLIPRLGIAGAALSSMSYQILQCVWMNIYVRRMIGFFPYRLSLSIQGLWILCLVGLYVLLNHQTFAFAPSILMKAGIYSAAILVIVATFYFQGLAGQKAKLPKRKKKS